VPQYRNNKLHNRYTFLRVPATLEEVKEQMLCALVDIEIASVDTNKSSSNFGEISGKSQWGYMDEDGSGKIEIAEDNRLLYCGVAKVALLHANTVIGKARVGEGCKSS